MSPVVGHIIVIAAIILLVAVCLKQIIGELKGGGCSGCSGGCSSCTSRCSSYAANGKGDGIDADKASKILKDIKGPKKI